MAEQLTRKILNTQHIYGPLVLLFPSPEAMIIHILHPGITSSLFSLRTLSYHSRYGLNETHISVMELYMDTEFLAPRTLQIM